jgi:hypothetical protein
VLDDTGRDVGHVVESQPCEIDAHLLLEAAHDGVPQRPLVREVAVDRSLVHAGARGHGTHRQRPPVADGRSVEDLRARGDWARRLIVFRRTTALLCSSSRAP